MNRVVCASELAIYFNSSNIQVNITWECGPFLLATVAKGPLPLPSDPLSPALSPTTLGSSSDHMSPKVDSLRQILSPTCRVGRAPGGTWGSSLSKVKEPCSSFGERQMSLFKANSVIWDKLRHLMANVIHVFHFLGDLSLVMWLAVFHPQTFIEE